jgi:hypothetical protein
MFVQVDINKSDPLPKVFVEGVASVYCVMIQEASLGDFRGRGLERTKLRSKELPVTAMVIKVSKKKDGYRN